MKWTLLLALAACSGEPVTDRTDRTALTACAGTTVEGVDVSDAQGSIDWAATRAAGIEWAAIKSTQGTYNTQQTFAASWSNARAAGVIRGAYHFFDPTEDGVAQANHFLAVVGTLAPDDLPPLLDLECPDGDSRCLGWAGGTGDAPAALIRGRMLDFMNTVERATGKRPVIYTFGSYLSSNDVDASGLDQWPLWIADPNGSGCYHVPAPWSNATIWQYSWSGDVAGIPSAVDRDRFLGSRDELLAFAGSGTATTQLASQGPWLSGFGTPDLAFAGDFDGDGRADLAWYEGWNDHAITIARSTGSSFASAGKWLAGWGMPDWAAAGDFDGDGRTDLAWYEAWNQGSITIARSTGGGFANAGAWQTGFGRPDRALVGDFNGDGKADLAWYEAWNSHGITIDLSTGGSFASAGQWITQLPAADWAAAGDFDGDGNADLAWFDAASGTASVLRSTGSSFAAPVAWLSGLPVPTRAFAADIDRDGRADLIWYTPSTVWVARSTGSAFAAPVAFVTGWGAPDWADAGDFDGDGRADIAWYELWNHGSVTTALAR